jgi:hypothetical protein
MLKTPVRSGLLFALVPLLLVGTLPSAGPLDGASAHEANLPRLELAALKSEARSMVLHIDGP